MFAELNDDRPPDDPRRREPLEESLAISRRIDDTDGIIESLIALAGERAFEKTSSRRPPWPSRPPCPPHKYADARLLSVVLNTRGHLEVSRGNPSLAVEFFTQTQVLSRDLGNEVAAATAELNIASGP